MNLILASSSPRRRMLLNEAGYSFVVIPSEEEEKKDYSLPPEEFAGSLARQKAEWVKNKLLSRGETLKADTVIIGADTNVIFGSEILGKPKSPDDAKQTLKKLSGKAHTVITGLCVIYGTSLEKTVVTSDSSNVLFNELSPEFIEEYVATGLPLDKAGSYGFQDGYDIVKGVEGSESNVIGLPMEKLEEILSGISK